MSATDTATIYCVNSEHAVLQVKANTMIEAVDAFIAQVYPGARKQPINDGARYAWTTDGHCWHVGAFIPGPMAENPGHVDIDATKGGA